MALSDLNIRKTKKHDKPYKLGDGGGLFLLVKPNGSKLLQQKYRYNGTERLLSHGQYPDMSLAHARQKRDEARALLAEGGDPSVQKRVGWFENEVEGWINERKLERDLGLEPLSLANWNKPSKPRPDGDEDWHK